VRVARYYQRHKNERNLWENSERDSACEIAVCTPSL